MMSADVTRSTLVAEVRKDAVAEARTPLAGRLAAFRHAPL